MSLVTPVPLLAAMIVVTAWAVVIAMTFVVMSRTVVFMVFYKTLGPADFKVGARFAACTNMYSYGRIWIIDGTICSHMVVSPKRSFIRVVVDYANVSCIVIWASIKASLKWKQPHTGGSGKSEFKEVAPAQLSERIAKTFFR